MPGSAESWSTSSEQGREAWTPTKARTCKPAAAGSVALEPLEALVDGGDGELDGAGEVFEAL